MVKQKLCSIFPEAEILFRNENEKYDFSIYTVKPTDKNYQLLVTDGLSKRNQEVTENHSKFAHIELYFCLPDYWDLERHSWPIYWLNKIAQVPQKNNTWFGPGDTIPAGNPPQPLSEQFTANHFILSEPLLLKDILSGDEWENEAFQFLSIIPIFQPETGFKLRNSSTVLIHRLQNKGVSEMIDIYRTSVCRKRILGF